VQLVAGGASVTHQRRIDEFNESRQTRIVKQLSRDFFLVTALKIRIQFGGDTTSGKIRL